MPRWSAPSFVEIAMNAEIGSYQNEFDEREPPAFVRRAREERVDEHAGEREHPEEGAEG